MQIGELIMQIGEHVAMGNGIEIRRAADELRGVDPHNLTRSRRYVISGMRGGLKSATSLMDAKQIAEKEIKSIEDEWSEYALRMEKNV